MKKSIIRYRGPKNIAVSIALASFALFVFQFCNPSGSALFYSVVQETALVDNETLPNNLSVIGMLETGGNYYLAAGSLYATDSSGESDGSDTMWSQLDPPMINGDEYSACLGIALLSGDIYALFSTVTATDAALFKLTGSISDPKWKVAYDPDHDTVGKPVYLVAASGSLIVSLRVDLAYTAVESQDGDLFTALSLPGQYTVVNDAASFQGDLWLVSGTLLYSNTGGDFSSVIGAGTPAEDGEVLGGLFTSTTLDTLFATSKNGGVYALNGGEWKLITRIEDKNNLLALTDLAEATINNNTVILVGTENGYYEIVFPGTTFLGSSFSKFEPGETGSLSSDDNYSITLLADTEVRTFYVDTSPSDGPLLFAGTSGNGLWRNPIDETSDPIVNKWDPE